MKKDRIVDILTICSMAIVAFALIYIFGPLFGPGYDVPPPTRSKANELSVASYAGSMVGELVVALKYYDGSKHILDIKNGVQAGEPQKYKLPCLPDGKIIIHITNSTINSSLLFDLDTMVFSSRKELKRNGLLIYFMEGSGLNLISGETRLCYAYDRSREKWYLLDDPYPIFSDEAGISAYKEYSGWRKNKWMYIGKDNAIEQNDN